MVNVLRELREDAFRKQERVAVKKLHSENKIKLLGIKNMMKMEGRNGTES